MGGNLGDTGTTALLIGIDGEERGMTITGSRLFFGCRAVFVVSARGGIPSKMVTSEIKSLTLIKAVINERSV